MKLSVIIVNYNVKYFLEQCLLSVRQASKTMEVEVIVVDNASSDESLSYLIPRFPEVTFIENKINSGFSKANNQAIKQARGEYILLLNPDTIVGEQVLENTRRFLDNRPDVGAIGVKMIDGEGVFLPESKRGFPSPWNSFCKMVGLTKLVPMSKTFAQYHLHYLDKEQTHEVDVLAGAFMLIRNEVLAQVGLLDEKFFMYGEDIDLSYRIKQAGYKNYYLPERIIHYKGESTRKDIRYVKIFYGAMLIFFNKHYPEKSFINWLIKTAIVLVAGMAGVSKLLPFKRRKKRKAQEIVFTIENQTAFEDIIYKIDTQHAPETSFAIYYPQSGIKISPNQVTIQST